MTLRERPVVREATLPDGRVVRVRVAVPDDAYVPRAELDTVVLELEEDGRPLGVVHTVLSASDRDEAFLLAERVRAGLESGALEATAHSVEPLALTPPA